LPATAYETASIPSNFESIELMSYAVVGRRFSLSSSFVSDELQEINIIDNNRSIDILMN
jgi:hypothetical protein